VTVIMAFTRFILPLTCALFLPLAAAAQTTAPAAATQACCAAMHQMPATTGTAPVDHSMHQATETPKPAMPGMAAGKANAGCCGGEKTTDKPMPKMDCCAGMGAKNGKDASPCEHCAAKAAGTAADKSATGCCAEKPKP